MRSRLTCNATMTINSAVNSQSDFLKYLNNLNTFFRLSPSLYIFLCQKNKFRKLLFLRLRHALGKQLFRFRNLSNRVFVERFRLGREADYVGAGVSFRAAALYVTLFLYGVEYAANRRPVDAKPLLDVPLQNKPLFLAQAVHHAHGAQLVSRQTVKALPLQKTHYGALKLPQ